MIYYFNVLLSLWFIILYGFSQLNHSFEKSNQSIHKHIIVTEDIDGKILSGITLKYYFNDGMKRNKNIDEYFIGKTDSSGRFEISGKVTGLVPSSNVDIYIPNQSIYNEVITGSAIISFDKSDSINVNVITLVQSNYYFTDEYQIESQKNKSNFGYDVIDKLSTENYVRSIFFEKSIGTIEFKGQQYLNFPIRNVETYNSITLNKSQIGYKIFEDQISPILNTIFMSYYSNDTLNGFSFEVSTKMNDLSTEYDTEIDLRYKFYFDKENLRELYNYDNTIQDLVKSSIIILNDSRIEIFPR